MKKTGFVSEVDQFLQGYDEAHPDKSPSQQQEINKHQRIAEQRDNPDAATPVKSQVVDIWEDF